MTKDWGLSLEINTDAINDMFKVGDKGDEYVLNEEESDKENELLKELDQIATVCISAMKR
ncbi:MAG: hypothetical protein IPK55_11020 [Streptococcus sp.]|nr:hypothetical protein [Streptococcus sp.]